MVDREPHAQSRITWWCKDRDMTAITENRPPPIFASHLNPSRLVDKWLNVNYRITEFVKEVKLKCWITDQSEKESFFQFGHSFTICI